MGHYVKVNKYTGRRELHGVPTAVAKEKCLKHCNRVWVIITLKCNNLRSQVDSSKQPKLGLTTQELSFS